MHTCREEQFYVIGVRERKIGTGPKRLTFHTTHGDFDAVASLGKGMRYGVVMLGGRNGGFGGPSALYPELAGRLLKQGIASIRLNYRFPQDCVKCAVDALLALQYLDDEGIHDSVLIGWSSGGPVAFAAGAVANRVRGVAAISTLEVADCCIRLLFDKPVLLIHGDADRVSPVEVPRRILQKSVKNHELVVYSGADHGMGGARDLLRRDLISWIQSTLGSKQAAT